MCGRHIVGWSWCHGGQKWRMLHVRTYTKKFVRSHACTRSHEITAFDSCYVVAWTLGRCCADWGAFCPLKAIKMDNGERHRPRRRSLSRENHYRRARTPNSRGRQHADFRRHQSRSLEQDVYRNRRRRRSPSHDNEYRMNKKRRSRRSPDDRFEEEEYERRSRHENDYRMNRNRRNNRSPDDRYEEEYERRPYHQRPESSNSVRRRESRRKPRRRQRRSPSSPPTPPFRRAGVVSDDDEGPTRQQNTEKAPQNCAPSSSGAHDDTKGHFQGGEGTMIANRYRVLRDVGLGTFGRVVEAVDLDRARRSTASRRGRDNDGPKVAIKIVRGIKRYYDSALIEADIVEAVNRRGGRGTALCAMMFDSFTWKSHYCLVFEALGPSLYDFMKRHDYQPFPMVCVRDFTMQLLEALEFLHSFGLIHTDLKPENILLCSSGEVNYNYRGRTFRVPESTRIKLIDFGGATYDSDKKKSSIINTRQYRAPEVILGATWSTKVDLWSAGCILAELYIGELLFATHDNTEHLALIEKCIGPFPRRLLARATSKLRTEAFDSSGRHRLDQVLPPENASYVRKAVPLETRIGNEDGLFLHILRRILVIDPDDRTPAHECLRYRL